MDDEDVLCELRPEGFKDFLPIAMSSQTTTWCTTNGMLRIELPKICGLSACEHTMQEENKTYTSRGSKV
jgi:hypothetical protein